MGRPPRSGAHSLIHHVTTRGNDRRDIFVDDHDREAMLAGLATARTRRHWWVLGYCLMGNHIHLLVEGSATQLSAGLRDALGKYARRFHRRHGTSGHLFGARFHSVTVAGDRQLAAALTYVLMNPVRAGLVSHPADWHWSSYGASVDEKPPTPLLDRERLWTHLARHDQHPALRIQALVRAQMYAVGGGMRA